MIPKKKVLLFRTGTVKEKQIRLLGNELDFTVTVVRRTDYLNNLGALAGITGFPRSTKKYAGAELAGEMLVFSGFSSEALDEFLAQYKNRGIEPIPLKAVLTPANIRWTPAALYEELRREHNARPVP